MMYLVVANERSPQKAIAREITALLLLLLLQLERTVKKKSK